MTSRVPIELSALALLLVACRGLSLIFPPTLIATSAPSLPPSPTVSPSATLTPTLVPTNAATIPPSETPLATLTLPPPLTFTPQWVWQGPGEIVVPILLYHHIGFSLRGELAYYISPQSFDQQMNLLYQWGYETISVELLARAVRQGAELPPKPIILTFDDGSETTYTTALPLMQRYGFTGVSYIVYNYIGTRHYMSADEIRALHSAGWEIGSHSLSHVDLTARPDRQLDEIVQSRRQLESLLGVPVTSFAYPFGAYDSDSVKHIHTAGYVAALGLGNESLQGDKNLFYLYRQAIAGTDDLRTFAQKLPWREDQIDLPPVTIVP